MDALHLFESAHKYYEEKIAQAAALAEDPTRAGGILGDDLEEDDGLLGTKVRTTLHVPLYVATLRAYKPTRHSHRKPQECLLIV